MLSMDQVINDSDAGSKHDDVLKNVSSMKGSNMWNTTNYGVGNIYDFQHLSKSLPKPDDDQQH